MKKLGLTIILTAFSITVKSQIVDVTGVSLGNMTIGNETGILYQFAGAQSGTDTTNQHQGGFGVLSGSNQISPIIWMYGNSDKNAFQVIRKSYNSTVQSGAVLFQVGASGNVGIGTTNPGSFVEIEKNFNGSSILEITNTDTGSAARRGIMIGNGSPGNSVYLLSTSANYNQVDSWMNSAVLGTDSQLFNGLVVRTSVGKIRFQPGGTTDKIVFTETGNVGIGTTNPDSKLTVAGNIHSQEVKVTVNAGADFVFEDNYNLPNLEEVQQFIQENGHLPEIASAKDMEENGIHLSEMNIKLLQKIEELTLYAIEQEKKLKEQDEEIAEIKKLLNQLLKK